VIGRISWLTCSRRIRVDFSRFHSPSLSKEGIHDRVPPYRADVTQPSVQALGRGP
jgi:hypothetical protein